MMGVGKTTIGKKLAQKLDFEFVDIDEYIERKFQLKIPQIFFTHGESYFRMLEEEFSQELAQKRSTVISTGGKTLLYRKNLNYLSSSGIVITLLASPDNILKRIQLEKNKRPLLDSFPAKRFCEIYRKRKHRYLNLPNRIDTSHLSEEKVVEKILKLIKGKKRKFDMKIEEKKSSLIVKRGIINDLSSHLKDFIQEKRVFVLSDETVFAIYRKELICELDKARLKYSIFLLSQGERHKNLKTVEKIYRWLFENKAARSSLFISFGGGVVSDIGGYVASTFHRGLNLVNVPTTLLSQIDASIGGKNGVNLKEAKNQFGTFYFPSLVLIDPLFLVSLDHRQMKEGIIEALKAGIIGDEELFRIIKNNPRGLLSKDMKLLDKVIMRAIKVKLNIVNQDPYEKKERKFLNLGHTFGHALESYSNYRKITHGQAVGLGMICACKMGTLLNISSENILSEIKNILSEMKSPIKLRDLEVSKIISLMEYDKKRTNNRVSFVIPRRIGEVLIKNNVNKNIIFESLKEISYG